MESPLSEITLKPEFTLNREFAYKGVIDDICNLNWCELSRDELINAAWAYYYFSIQFRENLEIARRYYPDDERLMDLDRGERNTDNLSPWPGVAAAGEKMNHDEFMRRALAQETISEARRGFLEELGQSYLTQIRAMDGMTRALSIASYEDGGLQAVFGANSSGTELGRACAAGVQALPEGAHPVR